MSLLTLTPLPTIVVVSFAAMTLAGCGASIHIGGDTTRRVESETVAIDGVRTIDVTTENGHVEVIGDRHTDEIEIDVVLTERNSGDADHSVALAGGVLDIVGDCDSSWFDPCSVGFVVTVPADRTVEVSTGSGAVELADLAGAIDVRTDNGAIRGTGLTGDTVVARSDNGHIDLVFDRPPTSVDVRTDNGAIDLLVPDTDYVVDADNDAGSINIDVTHDQRSPRSIRAESDNGSIDIGVRLRER